MSTDVSNDNILKLWEKLVEMRMFHDGTNQQRLRNFMVVEAAIMLAFVLVLVQVFDNRLILPQFVFLVLGSALCVMGFLLARRTARLDLYSQRHLQSIKRQLSALDAKLKPILAELDITQSDGVRYRRRRSQKASVSGFLIRSLRRQLRHTFIGRHKIRADRLLIRATSLAWLVAFLCMLGVLTVMMTPDLNVAMIKLSGHAIGQVI
ncbi:hypothetical protein [Asticcacaulis benevestitus]|uniref:Uncharacterized protein n=1 Tax=Asticcacaulis benevestitus DSM 16100 = ATCC BAA-896 TaxID=1121022 RepID=V4PMH2_9CAUL|nr:hypothetical protein [Asticcacaulis benevestitus]ESQ89456.1 hypothetical protein ABENE_13840 [Asticcacaulis benevestitus DSM 16100 = ATCC BAA-896]